jgi:hypothetical protein
MWVGNRIRKPTLDLSKLATHFALNPSRNTSNLTSPTPTASFVCKFTVSSIIKHPIRPLDRPYRLQKSNDPHGLHPFQRSKGFETHTPWVRFVDLYDEQHYLSAPPLGKRVSSSLACRIQNGCGSNLCAEPCPIRVVKVYLRRCRLSCFSQG